ncbi:MAG: FISUMP domain-containing protein, partial [Bacteroidota bacterium]
MTNTSWQTTTSGAYAIYNNDPVNDGLYGKLYNHYAVADSRGLCPTGWHVPSDGEWKVLTKYLDPSADTNTTSSTASTTAGGALKSTATQPTPGGWNSPNTGASNSSGFTALPGDVRGFSGVYGSWTAYAFLWSSSVLSGSFARSRELHWVSSNIWSGSYTRTYGFSVRCLKNTLPQVNTTSVTNVTPSTALVTGEVISEGDQNTTRGFCYSTTSNPTVSNDTTMNGTGLGVYSGTLQNLTPSTAYYVRAYATNSVGTSYGNEVSFTTSAAAPSFTCGTSTVPDVDNNIYNTVQIGTQCWTQSNLKTSRYRNGDSIPTGLSNSAWQNTTSGAYAIFDNNPVN